MGGEHQGSTDTKGGRTVFVAANPPDWDGWQVVLSRLAATESENQVVLGRTDDAGAVAAALLGGAGGWLFETPTPASPTVVCAPRPRWYRVTAADGKPIRLSAREVNVLQGIADGHSLQRVARDLGLSTLTVRNHITRAGRKTEARSRGHMVLLALRAGVIS